jgi:hypothetical protein
MSIEEEMTILSFTSEKEVLDDLEQDSKKIQKQKCKSFSVKKFDENAFYLAVSHRKESST